MSYRFPQQQQQQKHLESFLLLKDFQHFVFRFVVSTLKSPHPKANRHYSGLIKGPDDLGRSLRWGYSRQMKPGVWCFSKGNPPRIMVICPDGRSGWNFVPFFNVKILGMMKYVNITWIWDCWPDFLDFLVEFPRFLNVKYATSNVTLETTTNNPWNCVLPGKLPLDETGSRQHPRSLSGGAFWLKRPSESHFVPATIRIHGSQGSGNRWCWFQWDFGNKHPEKNGGFTKKSSYGDDHEDSCWLFFFQQRSSINWDSSRWNCSDQFLIIRICHAKSTSCFFQWLKYPSDPK